MERNKDLIVEERDLFVRVILNPDLNSDSKKSLISELVDKYIDRLVFVLEYKDRESKDLVCESIVSKTEKYKLKLVQEELEAHFTTIRGCDISKNDGTLTFYSPPKDINLVISFNQDTSIFEVNGNHNNLSKFLHGYRESIREIDISNFVDPIDTSSLNLTSIMDTMTLCEKIERNLWKPDNLEWPSLTDEPTPISFNDTSKPPNSSSTQTNTETQVPTDQSPILAEDTPSAPTNTDRQGPNPVIKESQTPSPSPIEDKLDLVLQKLSNLETQVEKIPLLSSRLDQVLEKVQLLNDRIDSFEDRMTKVENHIELTKKTDLKTTCSKLECRVFDLEETTSRLINLEKSFSRITVTQEGNPKEIDIDALIEAKLQKFQKQITNSQQSSAHNTQNSQNRSKYTPTSIDELNHDLLFIGDSNTYHIKEDIMKHGVSAAKIMAYKIDQAITAVKDLKVTRPPKQVFAHVGTNHLTTDPNQEHDIEEIKCQYEELFKVLEEKFPESSIHISEILMRGEDTLAGDIRQLNAFIRLSCSKRPNFSSILHSFNINSKSHLSGKRHLGKSGFHFFLLNIRLQMLGIAPRKTNSSQNRPRPYSHYHRR